MATFWVADTGNDANDGTSFAQAKATLAAGVALLSQGDTLNCVGSFAAVGTGASIDGTALKGTSYSDPACIIQGTDSSGDPAVCTVTATGTVNHEWLTFVNRPNYAIVRGFKFDATGMGNVEGQFLRCSGSNGHHPLRIEYCQCSGNNTVTYFYRPNMVFATSSYSASQEVDPGIIEIRFCYLQDAYVESDNGFRMNVHHCVFNHDDSTNFGSQAPCISMDSNLTSRGPNQMWNCTIDVYLRGTSPRPQSTFGDYNGSTLIGNDDLKVHNNLICYASSNLVDQTGQTFATGMISNRQSPSADVYSGVVGYNAFCFDAGFTSALGAGNTSIYEIYYNPDYPTTTVDATNIYLTDVQLDSTTVSEVINSTAAWTWTDVNGSGYNIDLPKDYRLTSSTLLVAGDDGGPVGAVEDLLNEAPIVNNPWPGAIDLVEITAGSTLSVPAVSGLVTTAEDPDGDPMTYVLVDDVTHGTLTLNTTDGSFDYTPDATYEGDDGFTYSVCDGTTCTNAIVDTAVQPFASFIVLAFPVVPPGDPAPVPVEYLDVAPFFRPTLEVTTEFRLKTKKNRRKHHDLANYTERVLWNESMHRVINLATNTSMEVTLGGVEEAEYLIVETDNDINVSVNGDSNYWQVSGVVALALTTVTSLHIQNESTTNEAQVILAVSD